MFKVKEYLLIITLSLLTTSLLHSEEDNKTFSNISPGVITISEQEYFDFLRISILEQPEYLFSVSEVTEKNMFLKFAQRNRWPELSVRVINDSVLKRDIQDITSVRKRRDDSFDAAVELSQPLYSGGAINARIGMAKNDFNVSKLIREKTVSEQIVQSNRIYLQAVKSDLLHKYGLEMRGRTLFK